MTIALLYWILMILWLVLGIAVHWMYHAPAAPASPVVYAPLGNHVFLFILLLLLGIGIFGWPVRG